MRKQGTANLGTRAVTASTTAAHTTGTPYPLHDGTFAISTDANLTRYAYLAGDLILLPQKVADGFITIALSYTTEGAVNEKTVSVVVPKPGDGTLEGGKAYTYDIDVIEETYSLKIGEVTLSSWEGKESQLIDWTEY